MHAHQPISKVPLFVCPPDTFSFSEHTRGRLASEQRPVSDLVSQASYCFCLSATSDSASKPKLQRLIVPLLWCHVLGESYSPVFDPCVPHCNPNLNFDVFSGVWTIGIVSCFDHVSHCGLTRVHILVL